MLRLYNHIAPKDPEWRHNIQETANMPSPTPSFYHDELSRALSEQSFGLTRYEVMRQSSAHEATAVVTLLEETTVRVSLTIRGYQVHFHIPTTVVIADPNSCFKG